MKAMSRRPFSSRNENPNTFIGLDNKDKVIELCRGTNKRSHSGQLRDLAKIGSKHIAPAFKHKQSKENGSRFGKQVRSGKNFGCML